jgi:quercetin dioxygenase-like cupin family protein
MCLGVRAAILAPMLIPADPETPLLHAGMRLDIVLDGAHARGRTALCELTAPRGAGMPTQLHTREDMTLVVVEGAVDVWRDRDRRRLCAPEAWELPRGVFHGFRAVSDEARVLLVLSPAGFETVLASASVTPDEPALDPDDVAALFTSAGVTVLGGALSPPPSSATAARPVVFTGVMRTGLLTVLSLLAVAAAAPAAPRGADHARGRPRLRRLRRG